MTITRGLGPPTMRFEGGEHEPWILRRQRGNRGIPSFSAVPRRIDGFKGKDVHEIRSSAHLCVAVVADHDDIGLSRFPSIYRRRL
ncbi:hypothetical protein PRUPE_1G145100 [Prunus persica]|uniref:Uncharacterized protein n=1 Tax=Prunus persica TaxID=3760 RepID=A0A251QXF6_PRUPE|nr:hypothetical protein PRUPE_1G145100 [Prunus persica]